VFTEWQRRDISDLILLLKQHHLSEIEWESHGVRIRLRSEGAGAISVPNTRDIVTTQADLSGESKPYGIQAIDTTGLSTITSPIVGTFYRSPSPDADVYVEEGDMVKKGQVLCIVEAMKLMNEIESEVNGRVVKILAESTKPVEYGQPLFLVDPTATG
jgi:acetyl-CoA carboxylase biotin carboxyl carrier protein